MVCVTALGDGKYRIATDDGRTTDMELERWRLPVFVTLINVASDNWLIVFSDNVTTTKCVLFNDSGFNVLSIVMAEDRVLCPLTDSKCRHLMFAAFPKVENVIARRVLKNASAEVRYAYVDKGRLVVCDECWFSVPNTIRPNRLGSMVASDDFVIMPWRNEKTRASLLAIPCLAVGKTSCMYKFCQLVTETMVAYVQETILVVHTASLLWLSVGLRGDRQFRVSFYNGPWRIVRCIDAVSLGDDKICLTMLATHCAAHVVVSIELGVESRIHCGVPTDLLDKYQDTTVPTCSSSNDESMAHFCKIIPETTGVHLKSLVATEPTTYVDILRCKRLFWSRLL
jgi:hypothetical protein